MTTSPVSSASPDLTARVGANVTALRERIARTGRDPASIRLVAVTKTFGVEAVDAALANGLHDLGENYVDELETKAARRRGARLTWHYIGALQSNKIARICSSAQVVATVSRTKELERVARSDHHPELLIQVDYTGAATRNGASADEVPALLRRARDLELEVRGLMTVAAPDPAMARSAFANLARLREELGLVECSMGMSDDVEIACELGTTELLSLIHI